MTKIIISYLIVIFSTIVVAFCQDSESDSTDNGLLYSTASLNKLKAIVDSLNQEFSTDDLNKRFYSKQQAVGHFIQLSKYNIKEAKKDIENNISYNDFLDKYPNTQIDDSLLIVKFIFKTFDSVDIVLFRSVQLGQDREHEFLYEDSTSLYTQNVSQSWIYDYSEETNYSDEKISAFYFIDNFISVPIPSKYSKFIQYSDFLIDTNSQIYLPNAREENRMEKTDTIGYITDFVKYIEKHNHKIDSTIANSTEFKQLLNNAMNEGITKAKSNEELEYWVGKCISKENELTLKRLRKVFGLCSLDDSPTRHAFSIAKLAAETTKWDIFLRAHLNIMNDRYERQSKISVGTADYQTYIKELEEININTLDLLLGISVHIENPSKNHYFGDTQRLGSAIKESKFVDQFESAMYNAIIDTNLDDYNRITSYYLYYNYNYYLKDENRKQKNNIILKNAVNLLPKYLSVRLNSDSYRFERFLRNEIDLIYRHFEVSKPIFLGGSLNWHSLTNRNNAWNAKFKDRTEPNNITFDVTMEVSGPHGSIMPLLAMKDELIKKVYSIDFLIDQIKQNPDREILIYFTIDKSFSNSAQESFLEEIPDSLKSEYINQLDDTVFLNLDNEFAWSRWLLFPNGDIMLWKFSSSSPLPQYSEQELKTPSASNYNNSFKIFDKFGNLKK